MKTACTAVAFLVMVQTAIAGDFNPFLGKADREPAVQRSATTKGRTSHAPPLPPLPPLAGNPTLPVPPSYRAPKPVENDDEPLIRIEGKIGDQVTMLDQYGIRSIVQNGSMKNGCFVSYPDVLCNKDGIAKAKTRVEAEARARAEEDATMASQQEKIKELEGVVAKMRVTANTAFADVAELKEVKGERDRLAATLAKVQLNLATAKAEAALAKKDGDATRLKDLTKEKERTAEQVFKLQAQIAASAVELAQLRASNGQLTASKAAVAAEQGKVEAIQTRLVDAQGKVAKLEAELASVKSSPEWVKGVSKQYMDAVLGKVLVSRADNHVFFRITNGNEDDADNFFGRTVVKKERKGEYTYYALLSKNVKLKE
jgi:hypothetical protein